MDEAASGSSDGPLRLPDDCRYRRDGYALSPVDDHCDSAYNRTMKPSVYIGTSGWNYPHWREVFYPTDCPKTLWLEYYAEQFPTVEVNATFYRLPRESTFDKWKDRTPEGFLWAVKANRYITHIKRLNDPEETLERFFPAVDRLGEKRGPILFQLPPSLTFDEHRFEEFCRALPASGYRYAVEVRHASWLTDRFYALLKKYGIALCISDTAGCYTLDETVTADFLYIRLHGSRKLYVSIYTEQELEHWADKIIAWDRDTYVYFDNDHAGHAPQNALRLSKLLGLS